MTPEQRQAVKEFLPDATFAECRSCASKPGTPLLCPSCIGNRYAITELQRIATEAIAENERLRADNMRLKTELAIAIKCESPADYDWSVLGRLDALEQANTDLRTQLEATMTKEGA